MLRRLFNTIMNTGEGQGTPSLDRLLKRLDSHLHPTETLVLPARESVPRNPFDTDLPHEQTFIGKLTPPQMRKLIPQLLPLMIGVGRSARMYDDGFTPTKSEASPEFMERLERFARQIGVADIRYVKVPRSAIFRDKGIPHKHAVVFTVEMDKAAIDQSPAFESLYEFMRGYKNLAIIGNKLARFMRKRGFAAYPGTSLGGLTDYVHLAELAGLGAIGYHGLLITPGEGARLRIATIYTNITNLPIATVNKHLWVRDFCAMCRKCVRQCPVHAIHDLPKPRGEQLNGGRQTIESAACRDQFTRNYGCGLCLATCPFSQYGYEVIKARFKGNPTAPQFRLSAASAQFEVV